MNLSGLMCLHVIVCELQLRARTTAALSPHFTHDRIWLNGV